MSLLERFASALNRHSPAEDDAQPAREALVDLLVWTMFVDRHLALAEHEHLDELTSGLAWSSIVGLRDFFSESVARARGVLDDSAAMEDYLRSIAERLGDQTARRNAAIASEHMMGADGKMRPEEVAHLRAVEKAFGLR
ncbi:MAG: hypothetical protein AAFY88_30650 [Acidobacteriota bacterium]